MERIRARFVGVELYFKNLERAKKFYVETMGLEVSDEQIGHHAKFDSGAGFVCLERKGAESYPSKDKAVLFFEVPDLRSAIAAIGQDRLVQSEGTWAVLHDPEGHNIRTPDMVHRKAVRFLPSGGGCNRVIHSELSARKRWVGLVECLAKSLQNSRPM